ncbi:hypothetical protein ACHQM5_001073 [Ranunculus cassubicifolius]
MSRVDYRNSSAPTVGSHREDDWTCHTCGNVNDSFRTSCSLRKCRGTRVAANTRKTTGRNKGRRKPAANTSIKMPKKTTSLSTTNTSEKETTNTANTSKEEIINTGKEEAANTSKEEIINTGKEEAANTSKEETAAFNKDDLPDIDYTHSGKSVKQFSDGNGNIWTVMAYTIPDPRDLEIAKFFASPPDPDEDDYGYYELDDVKECDKYLL